MRRFLIFILAALLLSCSPVRKYRNVPEVLGWEKDIQAFGQLDKDEKYPSDAILFAGSSSIRLWSTLERDMQPYHVIQRGYGGAKLSDFAVFAGRIFDPHQCSAIVLFVANDITGSPEDKTPEEVARLFKDVLKTIRKNHSSTPVFWIEITPVSSRWSIWPEIQKANELIRKICEKKSNTYFIQTHDYFLNDQGLPDDKLFRDDKLHLNEKGYKVWTEVIRKELDRIIKHHKGMSSKFY